MPIGTSDGEHFEDEFDMLRAPFGISAPAELPKGSLQGQVIANKVTNTVDKAATAIPALMDTEPGSIQQVERAADVAKMLITGPAPVANRMADGSLGSFMGVRSKTFDRAKLYEAQNSEMDGASVDDIWKNTGTFKGADGRWRQEIPDQGATLKPTGVDQIIDNSAPSWSSAGGVNKVTLKNTDLPANASLNDLVKYLNSDQQQKLGDVLDHPELFKAYPHLADVKVAPLSDNFVKDGITGMKMGNTLYMGPLKPEEFKATLLHEAQHFIQDHEGFARGGASSEFKSPQLEMAKQQLTNIKSEIEPQVAEALGGHYPLGRAKGLIDMEMEGTLPPKLSKELDTLKANDPTSYTRLKNILTSEKIIKDHESEASKLYNSLAGEVESRNVERRMNFSDRIRRANAPDITEALPREQQIVAMQNTRFKR